MNRFFAYVREPVRAGVVGKAVVPTESFDLVVLNMWVHSLFEV